jgi:hypothetical protein
MMPVKAALAFILIAIGLSLQFVGLFFAWLSAKAGQAAKWVLV